MILYSQTWHGPRQKGLDCDQLLLARSGWEPAAVTIRGISLTHRCTKPARAFAMAGCSAPSGDILGHVSGGGTVNLMYPHYSYFVFPPEGAHIDVHAFCDGGWHEAWLTVFYQRTNGDRGPVPFVDNDVLWELEGKFPVYARTKSHLNWRGKLEKWLRGF